MSNQQQSLCTCGCCEDGNGHHPLNVDNNPGLTALMYRIGTHSSFKAAMLRAMSKKEALKKFTSRYDDDMAVATLDAWATVLDVLTFYQERIINEGYLRTATERLSVIELARHISYTPGTGVAAGTYLAFSMNEAPGAALKAVIPVGTKVQSIPEQNQLPQVFETIEETEARLEWNSIPVQTTRKIIPGANGTSIYLKGISTGLQPGDGILMVGKDRKTNAGSEKWDFRKVKEVTVYNDAGYTKITWDRGLGIKLNNAAGQHAEKAEFAFYALRQKASLFGYNAPDFRTLSGTVKSEFLVDGLAADYYKGANFNTKVFSQTDSTINFTGWGKTSPVTGIDEDPFSVRWSGLIMPPVGGMITFYTDSDDGVRLWVNNQLIIENWTDHGSTENSKAILLEEGKLYSIRLDYYQNTGVAKIVLKWSAAGLPKAVIPETYFFNHSRYNDWPDFNITGISGEPETIHLDALYSKIVKDSWLVMFTGNAEELYSVNNAAESSRSNFTLNGKTTAVELVGENLVQKFNNHVRDTIVYAQSEQLEIADTPVTDAIKNEKEITLQKLSPSLTAGKIIILAGKRQRIKIPESANGLFTFTVENNGTASRVLHTDDSLIIVKKPETILNGKKWTLRDSGGTEGTLEVTGIELVPVPSEKEDELVSELHIIDQIKPGTDPTIIVLKDPVSNYYDTATLVIYANIAAATHGETRQETLGSGNASLVFQKFVLKQTPLTFISAASASGTATTLQVRVNDILWKEASTFYGASPKDKIYTVRINDDGKVTVMFGDGITGARLPTGTENIKATYRVGIGAEGLVNAGQLSMLLTQQLGVSKVSNPLAASGAEDPETMDKARQNAPLTVLTLDRIVSAKDFEDFTRAFAGIAKARTAILWSGEQQVVHITIAAEDKKPVDKKGTLYANLMNAIKAAGHNNNIIYADNYLPVDFSVSVRIKVNSDYIFDNVKTNVLQALKNAFSFEAREFGQGVTPAEVISVVQKVEGVVYTDLDELSGKDPFLVQPVRVDAALAHWQGDKVIAAELLTINEKKITITEITI